MVRKRLEDEGFDKPSEESNQLPETETSPDSFDNAMEQLVKNYERRAEVPGTRKDIVSRYEQPAPGVVEPPGRVPADRSGRVAAIVATVVLLGGVVGLALVVISNRNSVPIRIVDVAESIEAAEGCEWQLAIELRNNSDEFVTVVRISAVLNRGIRTGTLRQAPRLAPNEVGTHLVGFRLLGVDVCPAVDEINHGNIIFHLDDGSKESLRF